MPKVFREIFKQKNFDQFNTRISVQIVPDDENETFSVVYLVNGKQLEKYDCEDYTHAERDYNTMCDAIQHTVKVVRQSLGLTD
jgi:hypothetical protein